MREPEPCIERRSSQCRLWEDQSPKYVAKLLILLGASDMKGRAMARTLNPQVVDLVLALLEQERGAADAIAIVGRRRRSHLEVLNAFAGRRKG